MFSSPEEVLEITGYTVSFAAILRAQYIIEAYIGKSEHAITAQADMDVLGLAIAYQAAYMATDSDRVYEQVAVAAIQQNNSAVRYHPLDDTAPFIAPLAKLACKKLSWHGSRSIHTGSTRTRGQSPRGEWLTN